ncbi:Transcription termination factor MTERF15 [Cardamine amara subsp. amara]|uniref:Transcription termination factor MTERF15 n=1 Tax=Cardamine amara subsp. amara TaxID=228776 RepID=A0ABD1B4V9_CARAN
MYYSLILHGRRRSSHELRQWRNWRAAPMVNLLLQNASAFTESFSSVATAPANLCPEDDERRRKSFTVSYLIDSLGLTTKLAESISMKANFEEKGNPDSVLKLLRSYGFTDSQISSIITTYPKFLVENPEKSLSAKLHFLKLNGASRSELTEIVSKVPKILGKRREKWIINYYDYVKDILQDQDKIFKSTKKKDTNRTRNVSVLRELGVPERLLLNLLISRAKPVCGKEKFEESVKKIVEMGFDPTSPKFVSALYVFYELSDETIEQKVNAYQKLGLSENEVWAVFKKWPFSLKYSEKKIIQTFETLKRCGLTEEEVVAMVKRYPECVGTSEEKIVKSIETFLGLGFTKDEFMMIIKRHPQCIGLAADTVKKKTEFLVKTMGWPIKVVASTPIVLGFSLEKFIFPRCNVIKALMSKGLIGEIPPISTVLTSPKLKFSKIFVEKHEDVLPELHSIFTGDCISKE